MKTSSLSFSSAAAVVLAAAVLAASLAAQAPEPQQAPVQTPAAQAPAGAAEHEHDGPGEPGEHGGPGGVPRTFPAPTNLKVLPKSLTGKQVHDIMESWAGQLGVHCNACHVADRNDIGPNGHPRLKFADDSKPEKNAARLMVKMTRNANENYVSMVDAGKGKVTCGMCHRGHMKPEAFVPPPEHEGPPPAGAAGAQPPQPR